MTNILNEVVTETATDIVNNFATETLNGFGTFETFMCLLKAQI